MFVAAVFWLMSATAPRNNALAAASLHADPSIQFDYIQNAAAAKTASFPAADAGTGIPKVNIPERLHVIVYTVKPGDTVSEIAQTYGVSNSTIISFNGISDVRFIRPGMRLEIPTINGILYRVRPGNTLDQIARSHKVNLKSLIDVNHLKNDSIFPNQELFLPGAQMNTYAYRKAIGTLFIWPTRGVITSPFGMRRDPFSGTMEFHPGIDIANWIGTPIDAAADGTVTYVGYGRGYGKHIWINNGGGYATLYAHLSVELVSVGQWVHSGQEIAKMGDTGFATGPHLHFGIYKDGVPQNPLNYLQ